MEQRLGDKIAALFLRQEEIQDSARKQRCVCQSSKIPEKVQTPANATPTEQPAAADACSEVLVIGDSMTFALSKHGLGKLCGKSVTIKSTSGAVLATAARHTDIKAVKEIVLHVGTNCVNNNTAFESPTGIAD